MLLFKVIDQMYTLNATNAFGFILHNSYITVQLLIAVNRSVLPLMFWPQVIADLYYIFFVFLCCSLGIAHPSIAVPGVKLC